MVPDNKAFQLHIAGVYVLECFVTRVARKVGEFSYLWSAIAAHTGHTRLEFREDPKAVAS